MNKIGLITIVSVLLLCLTAAPAMADEIVWQYGTTGTSGSGPNELYRPQDAERLSNGNTLIVDYNNHRVIELDTDNNIVAFFDNKTNNIDAIQADLSSPGGYLYID